jgi:hypothetical protein
MHMFSKIGKLGATVAALAAVAVGASAVAGAASNSASSSSGASAAPQGYGAPPPQGYGAPPQGMPPRGGAMHKPETPLTGDVAAKVKAAAQKKVPGGTIERVETDSDHGSPYEAHVRKSDGTELEVLVNKSFEVTAVNTMRHP